MRGFRKIIRQFNPGNPVPVLGKMNEIWIFPESSSDEAGGIASCYCKVSSSIKALKQLGSIERTSRFQQYFLRARYDFKRHASLVEALTRTLLVAVFRVVFVTEFRFCKLAKKIERRLRLFKFDVNRPPCLTELVNLSSDEPIGILKAMAGLVSGFLGRQIPVHYFCTLYYRSPCGGNVTPFRKLYLMRRASVNTFEHLNF